MINKMIEKCSLSCAESPNIMFVFHVSELKSVWRGFDEFLKERQLISSLK